MKKILCKILSCCLILMTLNLRLLCRLPYAGTNPAAPLPSWCTAAEILGYLLIVYINFFPLLSVRRTSTTRSKVLEDGTALLQIFLVTTVFETVCCTAGLFRVIVLGQTSVPFLSSWTFWLRYLLSVFLVELLLFWNGILRVYLTSVQLGIRWRVIGIVCGFMPLVHLYVLCRIIRIAGSEVLLEEEKYLLNQIRAENQECRTRYPILLVHGVFFRDFRFFNYWGRIPGELKRNGAVLFYGNQQSAASVAECGQELAGRIRQILAETGCEKVNIIAHSKGGLDSRFAISACGAAPYIASLTTVSTPHRGCIFADYLLNKIPVKVQKSVARKYNAALKKCGDQNPDFLAAVQDLTASACERRNGELPNQPGILYQSVGSRMNCASSGRFPLNMAYPLVRHFDGANDGLVSVESAVFGEHFTLLTTEEGRGISHGDTIDLNRENIPGFDVREFYVNLVADLKEKGF